MFLANHSADEPARFAQSCTDAAFGYATAGMAAYANAMQQSMDCWSRFAGVEPRPAPNPWASPFSFWVAPLAAPANPWANLWSNPFFAAPLAAPANPWANLWSNPFFAAPPSAPANPWLTNTTMMPAFAAPWMAATMFNPWQQTAFASWPMAFWMMSSGVPGSVAFPTAKANLAAVDAAETAAKAVNRVYSSYQSGGGHAAWHLWPGLPAMMLTMAFLPKAMQAPWASLLRV